jgi:hypothetical protein
MFASLADRSPRTHLMAPGKPAAAASTLLARLVTRPDCAALLEPFLDWCLSALSGGDADLALLGVLASLLQTGTRETLLPLAPRLFVALTAAPAADASVLRRKLMLKVMQRLGEIFAASAASLLDLAS